jgi:2-amino-4-hydroxy-6-hydroxymethyldihydropteridine diphosphokinase
VIFLLLGSNQGDRIANLAGARERLLERLGFESFGNGKLPQVHFSPEVSTEAIGFEGPFFLNQIVAFEKPEITPRKLLNICKKIEIEMGRERHQAEYDAEGRRIYRDRIIDIDILAFDEVRCDTKSLTLPHPQVWSRPFVMEIAALLPKNIFKHFQTIVNN